jgi:hypothetical protein
MPEGIAELRKEFNSLVTEAKAFFKDVGRRGISNIDDWSWGFLTDEERARADEIRLRIRCLLTCLATPFQASPLLDNQDFRRFVRLGRAMDAALRFQAFRRVGIYPSEDLPYAPGVFETTSHELGELLDLIPEQSPTPSLVVQVDATPGSTEEHSTARERGPESERPVASSAS